MPFTTHPFLLLVPLYNRYEALEHDDRLKMMWMTVHCQQKSECFNQRVVIPDQLVKLLCVMIALVAEGRAVDVLYLYYSKAFDAAPHTILIDVLSILGLEGYIEANSEQ